MSFIMKQMMQSLAVHTDPVLDTVEWMHLMVLRAAANDTDNPTWAEAMNGPNARGFCKVMDKEIKMLEQDKDTWDVVKREPWMNVLPSIWAFKVKKLPDGTVRKLKARFCVQGDRQVQNVDYFETLCPVVSWTTVCLMLIMSSILDLSTIQAAAFLHAPIEEDVDVQMPRNYVKPGMILKLKQCLYGLKQSPRNFFLHLKAQLEGVGFTSNNNVDPCLFVSDKVICLIYVDDTLFFLPRKENIDQVIQKLKVDRQMDLEIESDVSGFLGVHVERDRTTGSITLTQCGLIKQIVNMLNVGSFPSVRTPASPKTTLPSHKLDGDPPQGLYSYPSVIGMLLYLANHTRPNISSAVAQCAQYNHSPKLQHEQALERISQYLKGTMDKGLVLKPDSSHPLDIDCYVDADYLDMSNHTTPLVLRVGLFMCSVYPIAHASGLASYST
jgi:Reverse transcriptase (RNA-dependent DNA polymerase)